MIFTGKRAVGKTHLALQELISRIKDGDSVGVVGYNKDISNYFVNRIIKSSINKNIEVKCIDLSEIDKVNHVFIDNLDMVLGDKCVCSSGGVVNVKREDEVYKEYELTIDFDKHTYQDKINELISNDSIILNKECNINGDIKFDVPRCAKLKELDKRVEHLKKIGNEAVSIGRCSSEYGQKEIEELDDDIIIIRTIREELHIYSWDNVSEKFFLIYLEK